MITIYTDMTLTKDVTNKRVVMELEAEDAMALATVLYNLDMVELPISHEWVDTLRKVARELIDAGNKCR